MNTMEEVLVHLHDVSVGYDVPLIEDINIEVIAGDVIAVLGPSGIGKTTLLRTIAGLVRPLEGDIELAVPSRGGLGYIPQRLGLVGNASVRTNIEMGTRVGLSRWHLPFIPVPAKQRRYAERAMDDLGISHLSEQPVRILSGVSNDVLQRPKQWRNGQNLSLQMSSLENLMTTTSTSSCAPFATLSKRKIQP